MTVCGFNVLGGDPQAPPTREEVLRAYDRTRVQRARTSRRSLLLLALLVGPGILTMLAENDGPSMLSYVATGAFYGVGFFVPFILLTFAMAYVVQEATVRIGVATHRGHAELIFERFGKAWGHFAMLDLMLGNVLTLMTELIAIRAGAAYFGVPPWLAIICAVGVVVGAFMTRRYFTWERFAMVLAAGNLVFVPAALFAHPHLAELQHALVFWGPVEGGVSATFVMLLLANVGATITPWMIFFQQSAVADKGLTHDDLRHSRADTALGAVLAAIAAVATLVVGSALFRHHVNVSSLASGADFARALRPFVGSAGAALFALGMIEAGLVAAIMISASSSYATGEVLRSGRSLNRSLTQATTFYATGILSITCASAIVMIPHAPLLAITLTVNVMATVLMAPALLFVLLLANDTEIMGPLANGRWANAAGGAVIAVVSLLGAVYGVIVAFPHLPGR